MTLSELYLPIGYQTEDLYRAVKKNLPKNVKINDLRIVKRSIDARKKPALRYVLTVSVNEPEQAPCQAEGPLRNEEPVIIIGAGPCGLFAALTLLRNRIPVILLERGESLEEREKSVEHFFETGELNTESNVQFGEGGAGTFSDGKLNTLTKSPKNEEILKTFVSFGAQEEILYDGKPHIGTDVLKIVIQNLRNELLSLGGSVRFSACVTDFLILDGRISGVEINHQETIHGSRVILAIGHSSRDTVKTLLKKGVSMSQKPFAMGVRIEHPQEMITLSQYGTLDFEELGAAPYKLTYTTKEGRGVYTFCMCPGGYVVNASSEEGRLTVNGMSYSDRGSGNANSALVVQVFPTDFPSDDVLSGMQLQQELEARTYEALQGRIPVQTYRDFTEGQTTEKLSGVTPKMKGAYGFYDLNRILPAFIRDALKEAIPVFGQRIKGFSRDDAVLSCIEARTSSPVRILRDEHFESNVKGLYPAGEGAGYSGGIMSSAKDGMLIAEEIIRSMEADYAGR